MFKTIPLIFLIAQVAVVFGIMTKGDLPGEIQNCFDNVIIPGLRLRQTEKCNSLDNDEECRPSEEIQINDSDDETKCVNKINGLKGMNFKFAKAYWKNEYLKIMKINLSSELPENVRVCFDSVKPIMQAYYQSAKDCEAFKQPDDSGSATDNSNTQDRYQECLEKIRDISEDPTFLKCYEIAYTLTNDQHRFLKPYMAKVIFEF